MATVLPPARTKYPTIADVQARIGNVPVARIRSYPAPGTATEADLLDESITGGRACELVDGILVEKPMGASEESIGMWVGHLILAFATQHQLGTVYGGQGPFRYESGQVRMPDVSFIRWDSVEDTDQIEAPGAFVRVPPDLAVEVLSPGNTRAEMAIKLAEYAAAGVQLVWYVDPVKKEVTVYPKGKERGKKVVGVDGVLDGGTVLPGFTLPVAKIFAKRAPAKKGKKPGKG